MFAHVLSHFHSRRNAEMSVFIFLSARGEVVDVMIQEGVIDALPVPVDHVIARALAVRAPRLLIGHTHPSGDPRPSDRDIRTTRQLCARLRRCGITVADHIILAQDSYFSFRMHRLL
ncbi:JAB domain-containing protein [Sphingobium subterraneum]|uniref:JAB domain-containing protein n=1 Tax=Sphingobium subterraneum TaxID=627688 RepID=UPI0016135AC4